MLCQPFLLNSSMAKQYTVFPNYVFEDRMEFSKEIVNKLLSDVDTLVDGGRVDETNYGWNTPKGTTLGTNLGRLTTLLGNKFLDITNKSWGKNLNIEMTDPKVHMVKPLHTISPIQTKYSWYTAVLFLQTTNVGPHLKLDNFNGGMINIPGVQSPDHLIKPVNNKVVFYPSHIPAGFTANLSRINCVGFTMNFMIKQ